MDIKRLEIAIPNRSRKKKLLKSSSLRRVWNFIGRRKNFLNCFGCGDNLWWKEDVSIAFKKPDQDDSTWQEDEQSFDQESENFYHIPHENITLTIFRHGVVICWECFIEKSEQELVLIFEYIKTQWMKNKHTPEEIQNIKDYKLLFPIRTTRGLFKKEM